MQSLGEGQHLALDQGSHQMMLPSLMQDKGSAGVTRGRASHNLGAKFSKFWLYVTLQL